MALIKFIDSNLEKEDIPNKSGSYTLYNAFRTPIYTGSSKKLRHRLQSYRQEDCFETHPTKEELRKRIKYFSYRLMLLKKARELERLKKNKMKYNYR